jgi:asparagine synthase (glutamine-hydrolysing)
MCGIIASFSGNGPLSKATLERAIAALNHRGPDHQGTWLSEDQRVGLGHARLSILDLTTGEQPIANENGRVRIVVNGEFYDFERQRRELEERGHRFRTRSDSEVALHLYEEFGAHAVHRLRGEFAFVLWDDAGQRLFAARDRFGIKPLFYAFHNGVLHLASEVKALFAAGVPARWDPESFYQYMTGPQMPDRTLFAGVYQVPPGHYIIATSGGMRVLRYWEFSYATAAELAASTRDEREYVEEFSAILEEAVRLRMRADVPVGVYLSGGLDSCTVLGLVARLSATPVKAFTLSFDREAYDEEPFAREMAAFAGADFHTVPVKMRDLADNFSSAVRHAETFFNNGNGVAKFMLSRAVRDAGYKVVYTGEGADEVLGGYPPFRTDMIRHHRNGLDAIEQQRLLKELDAANAAWRGLFPTGATSPLDRVERTLGFVPTMLVECSAAGQQRIELFSDDFKMRFADHNSIDFFLDALDIPGVLEGRDPLNASLFVFGRSFLASHILTVLGDRMEMAHSIEGRVPFLDHHVVEYLGRVPVTLKINGMLEKYLLREAAKPVITETIYRRQKHPFSSPPMTNAPNEPFHQMLQETLRGSALAALPFFDQRKVVALLDRLPKMPEAERISFDPTLTAILSASVLAEEFSLS